MFGGSIRAEAQFQFVKRADAPQFAADEVGRPQRLAQRRQRRRVERVVRADHALDNLRSDHLDLALLL